MKDSLESYSPKIFLVVKVILRNVKSPIIEDGRLSLIDTFKIVSVNELDKIRRRGWGTANGFIVNRNLKR